MAVFHRMFRNGPADGSAFHDVATFPSPTPVASGPRNDGQLTVAAVRATANVTTSRVFRITSIEYNPALTRCTVHASGGEPIEFVSTHVGTRPAGMLPDFRNAHIFRQPPSPRSKIRPEFLGIEAERPRFPV